MYLPNLNELLHYENNKILVRYQKDYSGTKIPAEEILCELMKFIWLCMKHKSERQNNRHNELLNFSCVIHPEMADIDNMWHTFLLFTRDYHDFCTRYLGGFFFHHEPIINTNDDSLDENYEQELTLYLSYIYDNLGEHTVTKWFGNNK